MQPVSTKNEVYYPVAKSHVELYLQGIRFYVKSDIILHKNEIQEKFVYVRRNDYESYLKQLTIFNPSTTEDPMDNLNAASEALLYSFSFQGASEQNMQLLTKVSEEVRKITSPNLKSLIQILISTPQLGPAMFRAVISKFIAAQQGWTTDVAVSKLTAAALFCDIGQVITDRKHHIYTSSELMQVSDMDPVVVQAVLQHHEYLDGSGPLRLKKFEIHPFAKIIRISDEFYPYFKKGHMLKGLEALKELAPLKLDQKFTNALTDKLSKK